MEVKHLDWGKCNWEQPKPSVLRKTYQGGKDYTITMGVIKPNHVPGPHKHDYEQTVIILKGRCDFHVGEEVFTFDSDMQKDGSVGFITIPGGVMHWIENPYDEPVYNMDIFYPKRVEDRPESVEVR